MPSAEPAGTHLRPTPPIRLAIVVTHPMTVDYLLRDQLAHLARRGFEVTVVTGPGEASGIPGVSRVEIPGLGRQIRPLGDLLALLRLVRALRGARPDIVNASTPKAGLLGMLAAWLARVPRRVYTLRGLRLETSSGAMKALLAAAERAAARRAHRIVAVSPSLRDRALATALDGFDRIEVLGSGSSNGVDTNRFAPRSKPSDGRLRRDLGLPEEAPVVGFVGRLTRDKGVEDLIAVFTDEVQPRVASARLLVVGGFERGDAIGAETRARLDANPAVILLGFVADAAPYYRLMDVLAFPSYREGFPNAPLEAAATGLPVAGYAATGTVDAVVDGVTGTLVPVGDTRALGQAIVSYLLDPTLGERHGQAARARAVEHFRNEIVWRRWEDFYRDCVATPGATGVRAREARA